MAGHNNKLCVKHKKNTSRLIHNNIGVFQGSPISPLLFIIYADSVMEDYIKESIKNKVSGDTIHIRNTEIEYKWSKHKIQSNNKEETKWAKPNDSCFTQTKKTMFYLQMIQVSIYKK